MRESHSSRGKLPDHTSLVVRTSMPQTLHHSMEAFVYVKARIFGNNSSNATHEGFSERESQATRLRALAACSTHSSGTPDASDCNNEVQFRRKCVNRYLAVNVCKARWPISIRI